MPQIGLGEVQSGATVPLAELDAFLPTGAKAETFSRRGATIAALSALTSARLFLTAVYLRAGQVISSATFLTSSGAAGTPLNQWAALYSPALAKLAVSADDTNTAWAAFSTKTFTYASPYTVTASGLYYVGLCVVATTPPTLQGIAHSSGMTGIAPKICGNSTTALADPASAPDPAAAITASGNEPWAYLS